MWTTEGQAVAIDILEEETHVSSQNISKPYSVFDKLLVSYPLSCHFPGLFDLSKICLYKDIHVFPLV